jgi:hypothetical protein
MLHDYESFEALWKLETNPPHRKLVLEVFERNYIKFLLTSEDFMCMV